MARDVILMFGDNPVMRINYDTGVFKVLNDKMLPYPMRGKLRVAPKLTGDYSYDLAQARIAERACREATIGWFANRTLLLSRANAKWIYNALNMNQSSAPHERLKVAFVCRAVSVLDRYWIKLDGDTAAWDKVDLKRNKLNEIIAQIALHGKSLTIQGSLTTPELTTNGAYAKAWRRHEDGQLWLHKLGANGNTESRIEVMCSNLLDKMNVEHVHYEAGEDEGKYVCMCPCMSTDSLSVLPAMEFYTYCNVNNLDFDKEAIRIDKDGYYKMFIVDYLISNRDRHSQNWGFYYDNETFEIVSTHPLFDHNNAFDIEYMIDVEAQYQCTGKSIRQSAKFAMTQVKFEFIEEITRKDFITERQWESFRWRAKDLGLM